MLQRTEVKLSICKIISTCGMACVASTKRFVGGTQALTLLSVAVTTETYTILQYLCFSSNAPGANLWHRLRPPAGRHSQAVVTTRSRHPHWRGSVMFFVPRVAIDCP